LTIHRLSGKMCTFAHIFSLFGGTYKGKKKG
jgi:hypothetical protein